MMRPNTAAPDRSGADPAGIDRLVDTLAPVRPLRLREGLLLALVAAAIAAAAVALGIGLRPDLASGNPHAMFFLRAAVLVGLGLAAARAALAEAAPAVGRRRSSAWKWALAVALLFPIGAALDWASEPVHTMARAQAILDPRYGMECLGVSSLCAAGVAVVMTWWVRRGAPSSPQRAGWLIGLAAGALGAAAFSVHCSENVVMYIGTWYSLAVAGCALAGRIVLPPLLRW